MNIGLLKISTAFGLFRFRHLVNYIAKIILSVAIWQICEECKWTTIQMKETLSVLKMTNIPFSCSGVFWA